MSRCISTGPTNARIAIVGEAPGREEEERGVPFIGSSGHELDKMLKDAGLNRTECYVTNVVMDRPPNNELNGVWISPKKENCDGTEVQFRGKRVKPHVVRDAERLYTELRALKPNVVVACGNTPLWALCPQTGVAKWRGSTLTSDVIEGLKVIPTYHPAAVLRQYDWRYITVQDFRRVRANSLYPHIIPPNWKLQIDPTYDDVLFQLNILISDAANNADGLDIICDLEIKRNRIVCLGIAWNRDEALCIPFYHRDGEGLPRWTPAQQLTILTLLHQLFTHRRVRFSNQNVSFDIQYLFWEWLFWPKASFDTMIAQNVLFPTGKMEGDQKKNKGAGGPGKRLDYLASMYCDYYVFWKDDGKFWDKPIIYKQLWQYNCMDCVYTFEVMERQRKALTTFGLDSQMRFQMRLFQHVMKMMLRGVKVDRQRKRELTKEIAQLNARLLDEVLLMSGFDFTGDKGGFSPDKLKRYFYDRLRLPVQKNKTFKDGKPVMSPTCDDEALKKLAKIEPLVMPLTHRINMVRSYSAVLPALGSSVDKDDRWRTSYNLAGTSTYRFASSENPFGSGTNMQNLTLGKEIE